ncbi:MAG: hypothetical protein V9E90_08550 [Saprospiraceae bacterium]
MKNLNSLLIGLSSLLIFAYETSAQNKQYVFEDEFNSSKSLVYYIENINTMEDDKFLENKWYQRKVNLKCFLENNTLIKDSLMVRIEFSLRPEEYTIQDELFYKATDSIVKIKASRIENLHGMQLISNTSTEFKTESVTVTIPSTTETVTNEKGESSKVDLPSKSITENVSVPTTHTTIETTPFRWVSIYIKLNQDDIRRIQNARDLKFRIYTNRGGYTIVLARYELNGLVKFITRCKG